MGHSGNNPYYLRDEDMVFRRLGEETVLVPIRKGIGDFNCFYVVNDLGQFLWERLNQPTTVDELTQAVTDAYEVESQTAQKDIHEFLENLEKLSAVKKALKPGEFNLEKGQL